ncbi:hypothetical protein IPG41_07075 [Candidatus Peregrinibacteria bacterium]|nr:MAG: hypothetical protein IPG41_07075 [Candidatus Peregrinibacteria bacterium]
MSTLKKRRMVSLPDEVEAALTQIARRDGVPSSTKAAHLIQLALEMDEDAVWDKIAAERDYKNARFVSHKDAWA